MRDRRSVRASVAVLFVLSVSGAALAQRSMTRINESVSEDFSHFSGTGVSPAPSAGELDSTEWRVVLSDDLVCDFEGSCSQVFFSRGSLQQPDEAGGLYAYLLEGDAPALGIQPSSVAFTPGHLTWRLRNDTGVALSRFALSFRFWQYNHTTRGQWIELAHSVDDSVYTPVWETTMLADAAAEPSWEGETVSRMLSGLEVPPGGTLLLKWSTDDALGSGARPAFALDDILIEPQCAAAADCDDGNPCTVSECHAGHCVTIASPAGSPCSDGDVCNGEETCDEEGACAPGEPLDCDDGNPCTSAGCDAELGCHYEPVLGCGLAGAVDASAVDATVDGVDAGPGEDRRDDAGAEPAIAAPSAPITGPGPDDPPGRDAGGGASAPSEDAGGCSCRSAVGGFRPRGWLVVGAVALALRLRRRLRRLPGSAARAAAPESYAA